MQKFGSLDNWRLVPQGEAIKFAVARLVRLEVVSPDSTDWKIAGKGTGEYFTTTSGRDVLEFVPPEGMCLVATNSVRIRTAEGVAVHIPETGKPSFAKVANRQPRNPDLERLAAIAAENATRRLDAMHREEMRRKDQQIQQYKGMIDEETGEINDAGHTDTSEDRGGVQKALTDHPAARSGVDKSGKELAQEAGGQSGELSNSNASIDEQTETEDA